MRPGCCCSSPSGHILLYASSSRCLATKRDLYWRCNKDLFFVFLHRRGRMSKASKTMLLIVVTVSARRDTIPWLTESVLHATITFAGPHCILIQPSCLSWGLPGNPIEHIWGFCRCDLVILVADAVRSCEHNDANEVLLQHWQTRLLLALLFVSW